MFDLTVDNTAGEEKLRLVLKGEIDISNAPGFKSKLYEMVGDGDKDVELFCDELSYIDSTGLGILVGVLKRVKKNERDVCIYHLKDNIRKLFRITGMDKVFILEETT